jgi:hypothetical protein
MATFWGVTLTFPGPKKDRTVDPLLPGHGRNGPGLRARRQSVAQLGWKIGSSQTIQSG